MLTAATPQREKNGSSRAFCAIHYRPAPRIDRHYACGNCKAKKLRCSGESPACQRCLSKAIECTYTAKRKRLHKKERMLPPRNQLLRDGVYAGAELKPITPEQKAFSVEEEPVELTMGASKMLLETPLGSSSCGRSDHLAIEEQPGFGVFMLTGDGAWLDVKDSRRGHLDEPSGASGNALEIGSSAMSDASDGSLAPVITQPHLSDAATFAVNDFSLTPCTSFAASSEPGNAFPDDIGAKSLNPTDGLPNTEGFAPGCECVKQAISDLEESVAWAEIISPVTAEAALVVNKKTMAGCEALLRCNKSCSSVAALLTLRAADKIIGILQRLHASYTSWAKKAIQHQSDGHLCDELLEWPIFVGSYPANTPKEWARVMDALLSLQLTRLQEMLAQGRSYVDESKERFQARMFEELQSRLRDVSGHFEEISRMSVP